MRNLSQNLKKLIVLGALTVALGAATVGIAQAVGGESDDQAAGPAAERAKQVAGQLVEGGYPVSVERIDQGSAAWKVKVAKPGLSVGTSLNEEEVARHVHVLLDPDFEWVAYDRDGGGD